MLITCESPALRSLFNAQDVKAALEDMASVVAKIDQMANAGTVDQVDVGILAILFNSMLEMAHYTLGCCHLKLRPDVSSAKGQVENSWPIYTLRHEGAAVSVKHIRLVPAAASGAYQTHMAQWLPYNISGDVPQIGYSKVRMS